MPGNMLGGLVSEIFFNMLIWGLIIFYFILVIKTGESGMVVFRLLTKDNRWTWVQSNARLVYKNGRPDYIIATQRPLT